MANISSKQYTEHKFKCRKDWLSSRGIGGSDVSTILNKNKYQTSVDLWKRLAKGESKEIQMNERMIEGTKAENHIRQLITLDLSHEGWKVKNPPKNNWIFKRKDYPLMSVSPDGFLINKELGLKVGLEIKDVEMKKTETKQDWDGRIPDNYFCQCLQYMLVINDLDGVCIVAHQKYYKYIDDKPIFDYAIDKPYWIWRKDVQSQIDYLFQKEKDFIEKNINGGKKPQVVISF